jgi:hypothetical protein
MHISTLLIGYQTPSRLDLKTENMRIISRFLHRITIPVERKTIQSVNDAEQGLSVLQMHPGSVMLHYVFSNLP